MNLLQILILHYSLFGLTVQWKCFFRFSFLIWVSIVDLFSFCCQSNFSCLIIMMIIIIQLLQFLKLALCLHWYCNCRWFQSVGRWFDFFYLFSRWLGSLSYWVSHGKPVVVFIESFQILPVIKSPCNLHVIFFLPFAPCYFMSQAHIFELRLKVGYALYPGTVTILLFCPVCRRQWSPTSSFSNYIKTRHFHSGRTSRFLRSWNSCSKFFVMLIW